MIVQHYKLNYPRKISIILLLICSFHNFAQSVQAYKEEAFLNNSKLQALKKQQEILEAEQKQETAWSPTKIRSGYFVGNPDISDGTIQGVLGVSQTIPILGYQKSLKKIAEIQTKIAANTFEIQKKKFFLELEQLYYQLYEYRATLKIQEDQLTMIKKYISKINTDSLGSYESTLILRQIEENELQNTIEILKGSLLNAENRFNQMLGRDGFDPLEIPDNFFMPDEEPTLLLDDITFHPELEMHEYHYELNESKLKLNTKDKFSSLTLGLDYFFINENNAVSSSSDQDFAMPNASVSIPFFSKKNRIQKKVLLVTIDKEEYNKINTKGNLESLLETAVTNRITARISYTSYQKAISLLQSLKLKLNDVDKSEIYKISNQIYTYKIKTIVAIANYFQQTAIFNYLQ